MGVSKHRIELRSSLSVVVLGSLFSIAGCASVASERSPRLEYPAAPFRLDSAEWSEPYAGPLGMPKGAPRAVLGTDSRTGGETYYAHFPAGSRFELH